MARTGLQDLLPLSPLQQGLLFHALYDGAGGDGGPDPYAVQLVLALAGPVDAAAMRAAGEALLRRHANLRAGFQMGRSGQPAQLIPHAVELPWCEVDLSDDDPQRRGDRVAELAAAERTHRFDLARPPALRLVLAHLGDAADGSQDHRLVMTSHHILLDGWSTPLLARELLTLYASGGDESALPPVPAYREYLTWLLDQDHEAARAAWDEALQGLEQPTRLAPVVDGAAGSGAEHAVELPEESTAAVVDAARHRGLTLNTVVQGCWALVLAGAIGRDDVVFGTTVAARPAEIPDVEHMVGLLINTVPVRVRLRPAEALCDALRRLQDEHARLLGSQHLGLAEIQRRTGLGELFDTLLVFENHPRDLLDERLGDVRITGVEAHDATHYPLTVVAAPGSRLRLALHHRTDAVTPDRAAALADRLRRLLALFASEPERAVGRCQGASTQETSRALAQGIAPAGGSVPTASLPALFAAQAARTPEAPAVRAGRHQLSYAELDHRADRLAHRLRAHGVTAETVVALALPRSIAHVVAFLAVQKTGGAALPVDVSQPAERLAFVLADAGPTLVMTTAAAGALPAQPGCERVLLDEQGGLADEAAATRLDADGVTPGPRDAGSSIGGDVPLAANPLDDPRRAAYVVYTSGSTGRPKGVVVTHTGIAGLVETARTRLGVGPGTRVAQFAALSFDVAVWEMCMALLSGGCLVVVPGEHRTDADALTRFAIDEGLGVLALPPSLLSVLPAEAELPDGLTLLVGAEPVPAELVRRWSPRARVVVAYGVTEATVNQTLWVAPTGWAGDVVPVGHPDPGTRVYVLDGGLQPQPPGEPGQLYIGGDRVAREYLGRPELTAERFVADPFGSPGSTMYRTGDLARWSPEGELELLGRADEQVQIRGFRVEPAEVESALLAHPAVAAAAVVARGDAPRSGSQRLVGYAVPADGTSLDPPGLRRHLAARLPDYMVPSALVELDGLPRTPNGKLDRAALPEPATPAADSQSAPRTADEELLARLVGEVLDVASVGVDDDFFSLGGDSISSIALVSRARREGVELSPRAVFEQRTVAGLARAARRLDTAAQPEGDDAELGRVPATPIIAWLREHDGVIEGHNQSMVVQAPADAGEPRLASALQAVLDHHAMLRARLRRGADGWELDVAPAGTVGADACLTRVDAAELDAEALDGLVDEHLAAATSRLDPDAGIMVQAVWFDAGPHRAGRLLCVVHHLVVDGVSWRILLPDLARAWRAVAAQRPVELEPVPTSFRQWAHGLVAEAHRPGREAELDQWREILEPHDPALSPVPIDRRRDVAATTRHVTRTLAPQLTAPLLADVPAAFHGGVNDVLLTALALAVADWRHQRGRSGGAGHAVLLNLEGHGREQQVVDGADLSRTVGWFTTTFPVRLDPGEIDLAEALRGGPSAGRAVKRIKEQLRALPDKGIGFGLLRYLNERTRDELAALRWPQIGFNYLGRFTTASPGDARPDELPALSQALSGSVDDDMPVAYVLEINVVTRDRDTGPELSATWSWPSALLSEGDVAELADGWFAALDALVAHASAPAAGGHTPSDLLMPLAQDDIDELEGLFADGPGA